MKLLEIKNLKENESNRILNILKELVEENLEVDLTGEDLDSVYNIEVTETMLSEISELIISKEDEWDYFDIMKILKIQ